MCSQSAVILLMSPTAPFSVVNVGGTELTFGMQRLTGGVCREARKKRLRLPPSSCELLSSPSVLTKLFALDICRKTARTKMMERAVRALADTFLCRLMACILRPLHASARSAYPVTLYLDRSILRRSSLRAWESVQDFCREAAQNSRSRSIRLMVISMVKAFCTRTGLAPVEVETKSIATPYHAALRVPQPPFCHVLPWQS